MGSYRLPQRSKIFAMDDFPRGGGGIMGQRRKVSPAMSLFRKDTKYVSDFTQFMNGYLQQHPDVAQGQVEGRALLWDKQVDRGIWEEYREGQVAQKPYVYQTNG